MDVNRVWAILDEDEPYNTVPFRGEEMLEKTSILLLRVLLMVVDGRIGILCIYAAAAVN